MFSKTGISLARTAPASWYTMPEFMQLEEQAVFGDSWLHVGHTDQVSRPGQYFSGKMLNQPFVVVRGEGGELFAHYNVCSHHAMPVARGDGQLDLLCSKGGSEFVCPYHGWRYRANGRLREAKQIRGIQDFRARDYGLKPIHVATLGQLIFLNFSAEKPSMSLEDWAGPLQRELAQVGGIGARYAHVDNEESGQDPDRLVHVARRVYPIPCNWKVFVDNFCDGGYHVPYAHPELAAGIDMSTYSTNLWPRLSIQSVSGQDRGDVTEAVGSGEQKADDLNEARLGRGAGYAYLWPNLMINRYGPWMDTNTVLPRGVDQCDVVFDYFLEPHLANDDEYVQNCLQASDRVQQEDHDLCIGVQQGYGSRAYSQGRFVPEFEAPMYHFHSHLRDAYAAYLGLEADEMKPGTLG